MKDCHLLHPDTSCDIAPEKGWKYSVESKNGILWVPDQNIRVVAQNPRVCFFVLAWTRALHARQKMMNGRCVERKSLEHLF